MLSQVQEGTILDNQENQGTIFCERGFTEKTISQTPELIFSSGPVGHSEVDVDFVVFSRF